uniref:Uncharacterized protein LOC108038295 n=1 Tax=Drosophila rhopaloa TaxID=1041015 RepID=A0A6P4E5K9_DRORH
MRQLKVYMWQLLIVFGCLLPGYQVRAVFLEECKGVIILKIPNENKECSEYVHCDGDDSYYCNGDCREAVECYNKDVTTKAPVTTLKPVEPTTKNSTSEELPVPASTTTVTPTTKADTTSPSISTPATTTPIPNTDVHVICKTSGKSGVYPYPANSNYYYQCLSGYLLLQQCPQNFHFDESQGQCISKKPNRLSGLHL